MTLKSKWLPALVLTAMLPLVGAGCSGSDTSDAGIMKSTDGGRTFSFVNNISEEENLSSTNILALLINPRNPNELIAGTDGFGFYFTGNEGEQWGQLPLPVGTANAIGLDPSDAENLFFALDSSIYKTDDGGQSYREVYVDQTGSVLGVRVHPKDSDRVYAIVDSGAVLISGDAGENWKILETLEYQPKKLVFAPDDANTFYVATDGDGVYVSRDNGKTLTQSGYDSLYGIASDALYVYDISIDPNEPSNIMLATYYGVVQSTNAGRSWSRVPTLVPNSSAYIRSIAFHPNVEGTVFFGANNKLYVSEDRGRTWSVVELPTNREIYSIAIHPEDKNKIYLGIKGEVEKKQPTDILSF